MHEWFKPRIDVGKLHDKFKFLLDPQYHSERELLIEWIDDFKIKDGIDKTIDEFQRNFHSMFWEIYLNKIFIESGFSLSDDGASPDFCLLKNDGKIFVEAVVSNIAKEEPKEDKRTLADVYGINNHYMTLDESITRLYNSFCEKQKKYTEKYSTRPDVQSSPFVLAIGDYAQINYGQSFYYPLLALLYGAYYDKNEEKPHLKILCEDSFYKEYKFTDSHVKKNGAELKIGIFRTREYEHISAIIYSCTTTLGKLTSLSESHIPLEKCIVVDRESSGVEYRILRYSGQQPDEVLHDGLFIYHNPYAKNKLPSDFLIENGVTHITYDEEAEAAISIFPSHKNGALKRRQVCMKGTEAELIEDFDSFIFLPVQRT